MKLLMIAGWPLDHERLLLWVFRGLPTVADIFLTSTNDSKRGCQRLLQVLIFFNHLLQLCRSSREELERPLVVKLKSLTIFYTDTV